MHSTVGSAARNLTNSSPQTEATSFAFASVFVLLLCIKCYTGGSSAAEHGVAGRGAHPHQPADQLLPLAGHVRGGDWQRQLRPHDPGRCVHLLLPESPQLGRHQVYTSRRGITESQQ